MFAKIFQFSQTDKLSIFPHFVNNNSAAWNASYQLEWNSVHWIYRPSKRF